MLSEDRVGFRSRSETLRLLLEDATFFSAREKGASFNEYYSIEVVQKFMVMSYVVLLSRYTLRFTVKKRLKND